MSPLIGVIAAWSLCVCCGILVTIGMALCLGLVTLHD